MAPHHAVARAHRRRATHCQLLPTVRLAVVEPKVVEPSAAVAAEDVEPVGGVAPHGAGAVPGGGRRAARAQLLPAGGAALPAMGFSSTLGPKRWSKPFKTSQHPGVPWLLCPIPRRFWTPGQTFEEEEVILETAWPQPLEPTSPCRRNPQRRRSHPQAQTRPWNALRGSLDRCRWLRSPIAWPGTCPACFNKAPTSTARESSSNLSKRWRKRRAGPCGWHHVPSPMEPKLLGQ